MRQRRLRIGSSAIAALLLLAACGGIGCDRAAALGTRPQPAVAMIAVDPTAAVPTALEATLLATLQPGRPTMLAAMPNGAIYVAQAPDDDTTSNDVLVIAPGSTTATHSPLTAHAVMRALNLDDSVPATASSTQRARPRAAGRFTAIAARADGKLAFAFAGMNDRGPFFAMGTFDPAGSGSIFLPVDQLTLHGVGDDDVATDAARQHLFTHGDDAWLWRATEREMRLVTVGKLTDLSPVLGAKRLTLDHLRDATTADLERSGFDWTATPDRGRFLLTDTAKRWIRRIDETGELTHVARFESDAVATLSAAAQDAAGRVIVFGCNGDGVAHSLLVQDGGTFKALPTSAFTVPTPLDATRLQIDRLLAVPTQANAFVAYDGTSGTVVRIKLR